MLYSMIEEKMWMCPYCEREHEIEIRTRSSINLIKGESVESPELFFYCRESDEEFVPASVGDNNLLAARDSYRSRFGLLTSSDIAAIRAKYHLSQKDFSLLLGFGEITVTRYETKQIQERIYDDAMRRANTDPSFMLDSLKLNQSSFSDDKYQEIRTMLMGEIASTPISEDYRKAMAKQYYTYEEPNDLNGNTTLDISKTTAMLTWFTLKIAGLAKVKLMKLMWYADALSYMKRNQSISGLVYRHMPYGALPIGAEEMLRIAPIRIEETELDDHVVVFIRPRSDSRSKEVLLHLDENDIEVLLEVKTKLGRFTGVELSNIMHEESAYRQTDRFEIIPFTYAKQLKAFSTIK